MADTTTTPIIVNANVTTAQDEWAQMSKEDKLKAARVTLSQMTTFETTLGLSSTGFTVEFLFPNMFNAGFSSNFNANKFHNLDWTSMSDVALQQLADCVANETQRRRALSNIMDEGKE